MEEKLTEVEFWNNYWASCKVPVEVDFDFSADRCLAEFMQKNLRSGQGQSAFEIGCAPGKWLGWLYKHLGYLPCGIEYSEAGILATRRNFEALHYPTDGLVCGDFFKIEPAVQHDLVLSLGFIEHFTSPEQVVERHLLWLKPGGTLILGVPNFRGVYRPVQAWLDPSILDKHNLEIMQPEFFNRIAREFGLQIKTCSYIGSLEPALPIFKTHPALGQRMFRRMLYYLGLIRQNRALDSLNHPWFSGSLVALFTKPA